MQYLEQYKQMLRVMNQVEGVNLDLEHDGKRFTDARIEFGYVVFHLEKKRVDKMFVNIAGVMDEHLDAAFRSGQESMMGGLF